MAVAALNRQIAEALQRQNAANLREIRTLAYTVASGFDRAEITILDACERCTRSQELRQRGSQQEGDDRERDQDLDERENFLSVATPRHSQKAGWFHWQERIR